MIYGTILTVTVIGYINTRRQLSHVYHATVTVPTVTVTVDMSTSPRSGVNCYRPHGELSQLQYIVQ